MENKNEIPRRNRMDLWEPSEKLIQHTVWEIEKMGADVRLTNAVNLLSQAKDLVSDFIDERISAELELQLRDKGEEIANDDESQIINDALDWYVAGGKANNTLVSGFMGKELTYFTKEQLIKVVHAINHECEKRIEVFKSAMEFQSQLRDYEKNNER